MMNIIIIYPEFNILCCEMSSCCHPISILMASQIIEMPWMDLSGQIDDDNDQVSLFLFFMINRFVIVFKWQKLCTYLLLITAFHQLLSFFNWGISPFGGALLILIDRNKLVNMSWGLWLKGAYRTSSSLGWQVTGR